MPSLLALLLATSRVISNIVVARLPDQQQSPRFPPKASTRQAPRSLTSRLSALSSPSPLTNDTVPRFPSTTDQRHTTHRRTPRHRYRHRHKSSISLRRSIYSLQPYRVLKRDRLNKTTICFLTSKPSTPPHCAYRLKPHRDRL